MAQSLNFMLGGTWRIQKPVRGGRTGLVLSSLSSLAKFLSKTKQQK